MTLHQAVVRGKLLAVKRLLDDPTTEVNEPDRYECTPLWWAVKDQKTEIVALLLEHGAKPGSKRRR